MRRKLLTLAIVYGVSILCLLWVFHGIDFRKLKYNLEAVSWPYLLLAALLNLSIYFTNAWRWELLLRPVARVKFWYSLHAIYIGLFLNEALPLRPGEIVRCGLLSRWTRPFLPFSVAVSSAMIERLLEAAWLQIGFLVVVLFAPVPESLIYGFAIVSGALLCLTVALIVITRRSQPADGIHHENRLARHWRQLVSGLRLMANTRTMILVAALSLVALLLNVLATWALIKTCRIPLPLAAAAAVLIIVRVGTAIPATPGSVGTYQFFSFLALRLFGVAKTTAAAFTVIAFAAFSLPLLIGGAIAFVLVGADFSDLLTLRSRLPSKSAANDNP